MKKSYFKLSLLVVFLSFLWSCQQELLQTEQDYNVQSQNITVQRLNREQLKMQHPDVMQKVENLISKKHLAKGIYTDAENGFSIDTDASVYIEDQYGNKTYTFKAITDKKDQAVLQNIVLKDLGDGTFNVKMVEYDQEFLENRTQTSADFLKQHIALYNLGDKKGSDIFGKYDPCSFAVPISGVTPATTCTSSEHHTNPADCNCNGSNGCDPPTSEGYTTLFVMVEGGCGPGGSGNTSGSTGSGTSGSTGGNHGSGGTTLPVGGGGAELNEPCKKLFAMLSRTVDTNPSVTIAQLGAIIQNHLPANNPQNDGKKELGIAVFTKPNDPVLHAEQQETSASESIGMFWHLNHTYKYIFLGHDHPAPVSSGGLSIFSLTDVYQWLLMFNDGIADNNTYFYATTAQSTKYFIRFTNNDFKDWMNQNSFFYGWDLPLPQGMRNEFIENKEDKYGEYVKYNKTPEENLKGFCEFFNDKDILGIDMIEVLPNGEAYKLMYSNGSVIKTKCN